MTCPPCTHDCEQGKTCPAQDKSMYDDGLHAKASDYASNRRDSYLAQMQLGKVKKKTQDELNWIWVAHYEGYKEGHWTATSDDRYTTDPIKLKEKNK